MEEALRCVKQKGLKNEIIDQINQVYLHKKLNLPLELVGATGSSRTDDFDEKNEKNPTKIEL